MVWAVCGMPVYAADLQQLTAARQPDGLLVSATVDLTLAPSMELALSRAVPLYFVVQADVLRERWYWSDKRVAGASRTYRLAYQPLTRRWRVSVAAGSTPGSTLQYALHQNYDSLAVALDSITKFSGWQVADAARLEGESDLMLDFRFKLDLALLPRPFQLSMNAQHEWNLDVRQRIPVADAAAQPPAPGAAPADVPAPPKTDPAAATAAPGAAVTKTP